MSRIIDNLIAFKMLTMLITPFEKTPAFKLGIIDATGHNVIKPSKFTTDDQKEAYSYLIRLIFNIKKLLGKLPGGDSNIKNLIAAYWMVKETYQHKKSLVNLEEDLIALVNSNVILVEEQISVKKFLRKLQEDGEGGAPANSTGGPGADPVSVKQTVISKKAAKKYKEGNVTPSPIIGMARRPKPVE